MLKVIIYKTKNCPKCKMTEKRLDPHITVEERLISDYPSVMEHLKIQGWRVMPYVEVYRDGELIRNWHDLQFKEVDKVNALLS